MSTSTLTRPDTYDAASVAGTAGTALRQSRQES